MNLGPATVLSAVSMVHGLARIPFALVRGVVADFFSPLIAVAALGGTFLVVGDCSCGDHRFGTGPSRA